MAATILLHCNRYTLSNYQCHTPLNRHAYFDRYAFINQWHLPRSMLGNNKRHTIRYIIVLCNLDCYTSAGNPALQIFRIFWNSSLNSRDLTILKKGIGKAGKNIGSHLQSTKLSAFSEKQIPKMIKKI
jgi:hypothetical protein